VVGKLSAMNFVEQLGGTQFGVDDQVWKVPKKEG